MLLSKKTVFAIIICSFSVLALYSEPTAAIQYDEVEFAYIGNIPSWPSLYGDLTPETTACNQFSRTAALGWDAGRRSMVIDLGRTKRINKIIWRNDLVDKAGVPGNLNRANLTLFHSDDNRKYVKINDDFSFLVRKGLPGEGAFDIIELSGFDICSRYIKVAHGYNGTNSLFGSRNEQQACRVFIRSDLNADIAKMSGEDMLTVGVNNLMVEVKGSPEAMRELVLEARLGEYRQKGEIIARSVVPASGGIVPLKIDLLKMQPGNYSLRISLCGKDGRIFSEQDRNVNVYSRILKDRDLAKNPEVVSNDLILLNDFSKGVAPLEAVSKKKQPGLWELKEYRVEGQDDCGKMLVAQDDKCPVLTYSPGAAGCYAIYLGGLAGGSLEVKIDGEAEFQTITMPGEKSDGAYLREVFWRCTDMGGKKIVFRKTDNRQPGSLAYIKLLALTAEKAQRQKENTHKGNRKRVISNWDGYSTFYRGRTHDRASTEALVNSYQDQVDFCIGLSDVFNYDSKVGSFLDTKYITSELRKGDILAYERIKKMNELGDVPLKVVVSQAHRNGIQAFASLRMNAFGGGPGEFFKSHPEFAVIGSDGKKYSSGKFQSFVFPEVRQFRLDVLKEVAAFGVDGVNLDFMRYPLFFGYEKPLVDGFTGKYGIRPEAIEPTDQRWLLWQAEYLTKFFRDLRRELAQTGHAVKISARIPSTLDESLAKGLDVSTWVKEGLVDMIIPVLSPHDEQCDISGFRKLVKGTATALCPSIDPTLSGRDPSAEDEKPGAPLKTPNSRMDITRLKVRIAELYRQGADGVYFFNFGPDPALQRELMNGAALLYWADYARPAMMRCQAVTFP